MIQMREDYKPDLVICPTLGDRHQDHQIVAEQACRAFWDRSIWGFESILKCRKFVANLYVPVTLIHMTKKMEAAQMYGSQLSKDHFPGQPDVLMSQAKLRGMQCGADLAEAFEAIQVII